MIFVGGNHSTTNTPPVLTLTPAAQVGAPVWLRTAQEDGAVDSCVPQEILQERWLEDSAGAQRQYLTSWQPSVVTSRKLNKKKFVVAATTADGKHHYGQYKESWEVADGFDLTETALVQEWVASCAHSQITTPLPPLSPPSQSKACKKPLGQPQAAKKPMVNPKLPTGRPSDKKKTRKRKELSMEVDQLAGTNPSHLSERDLRAAKRATR